MGMATVAQQSDLVALRHPSWEGIAVADLPVQEVGCFVDRCSYPWIQIRDKFPNVIHIAVLKPRLLDLHVGFVGQLSGDNPVELFAASECVLH